MSELSDLQIFYGEATSSAAHVYARLPQRPEWKNARLHGVVRGPRAEGIRTLPTATGLVDLGPGDSILARAIVPDPGFWTTDVPAVYDVDVELRDEGGVIAAVPRAIGIRQFGAAGTSWYFGGRRWVLRGLLMDDLTADEVDVLRSTNACCVVKEPKAETCETASLRGVVLVPLLQGNAGHVHRELRRLSRWPAIALAIIDAELPEGADLKSVAPNVELVHLCRGEVAEETIPEWATAVAGVVEDAVRFGKQFENSTLPVLAIRKADSEILSENLKNREGQEHFAPKTAQNEPVPGGFPIDSNMDLSERRAVCDRLQRDLAQHGDFAGYIV